MKFALPALLLALTALFGSPAWATGTLPADGQAVEAGEGDGSRISTSDQIESADLDDARSRVTTIWGMAQRAPKFSSVGIEAPTTQQLVSMELEGLKESAFLAAQASIDAARMAASEMTVQRDGEAVKITGDGTKNAIQASAGFLEQALDGLRSGETEGFDTLAQGSAEEIGNAKDGIAQLDQAQQAGRVAGLTELLSHAEIALSVVSETRRFIANPTLAAARPDPGNDGAAIGTEQSGGSIVDQIRSVFTLGNIILFLVLIGWAVTAYWGFANRSRYLATQDQLAKSKREVSDAKLELTTKDQEVERLERQKRAANAQAEERAAALTTQAKQTLRDEDAHLQRRAPTPPPPPPRSKLPDLKREIDVYLSSGGRLKQGDYRAILTSFGSIHGLAPSQDGTASLQDDESTRQRHVTAIVVDDTGEVAIVPSAYFVSKFSMQFTSELQLSSETKTFFEIGSGIPQKLCVDSIGSASMIDRSTITNIRKGSLSGFELA